MYRHLLEDCAHGNGRFAFFVRRLRSKQHNGRKHPKALLDIDITSERRLLPCYNLITTFVSY